MDDICLGYQRVKVQDKLNHCHRLLVGQAETKAGGRSGALCAAVGSADVTAAHLTMVIIMSIQHLLLPNSQG
jgi:hypothetical protein